MGRTRKIKGFTLLEATLGIAISALLLGSLVLVFKVGKSSWNVSNQQSELLQHARIAMTRLSSELRYATGLTQADMLVVEFTTKVLVDSDNSTTETIRYEVVGNTIQRSVNAGTKQIVAGDSFAGRVIARFYSVVPVKLDGGSNVVPLDILDPLSMAVGIRVAMSMQDPYSKTVVVSTMANFRDK